MPTKVNLNNISIVLQRPRFPENIGAVARAMRNMGIEDLIVVDPENCDLNRVCKMATHAALDVVERMEVCSDLTKALADFTYVVGTTARIGGQRKSLSTPARLAAKLFSISHSSCLNICLLIYL